MKVYTCIFSMMYSMLSISDMVPRNQCQRSGLSQSTPPPLPSPQAYAFSEGEVDATSQDFESLLWWDFLESQYIGHTENKFTKMDSLSGINTSLLSAHLPGIPESGITPGDCSKVAGSKGIGSSDWSVSLLR